MDGRKLVLEVNNSEFFKASVSNIFGEQIFNGFTTELIEPSQVSSMQIEDTGHVAVAWAVDIWKENADGVWDSSYDLFYRIIDTVSGTFVTEEVRLTDNFQSEYITWLFSDEQGGVDIGFEDGKKMFNVGSDQLGGYKEPVLLVNSSMNWIEEEVSEEIDSVSSSIANLSDFSEPFIFSIGNSNQFIIIPDYGVKFDNYGIGSHSTDLQGSVVKVVSAQKGPGSDAYAILFESGRVEVFPAEAHGGDISEVASDLMSGVQDIVGYANGFAALKSDGSVIRWGNSTDTSQHDDLDIELQSGVEKILSTNGCYCPKGKRISHRI